MLIVCKYGGTSLENGERIRSAAQRMTELARQGHRVVTVVSAQGDTTDRLIRSARQISRCCSPRELDACLAAGEQMAASLMAMAIGELDRSAVSLTGWQAGIRTDGVHGNARILSVDTRRIRRELDKGRIVVAAGFQGLGPGEDITTLGRGGSDTTAVALAAHLGADRCRIYTDVPGVFDRDPRKYPDAVRFPVISYEKMLELIGSGAQVLHGPCVELAREFGITVEVLSSLEDGPGTLVGNLESF